MKALTVQPMTADSARLDDVDEPPDADGPVLVQTLAVGVCGTDIEIVSGAYGWAPPGRDRLVLGHESLGRVLEAPAGAPVVAGDLVVGIVRRPDPVPCENCGAGEWDFCKNGQYTERGIKARDGYCSERYRIEPDFVVKLAPALGRAGVLLEPTTVWFSRTIERLSIPASTSMDRPPEDTPVRHTTPLGPRCSMASKTRPPTPVHSITTSGLGQASSMLPVW